jgi:hypothetical protein
MTDVEDLVRERYMEVLTAERPAADAETVDGLVRCARSKRLDRVMVGGFVTAGIALAITVGAHALLSVPSTPIGVPTPPPSASAAPVSNSDGEVTYVRSLPGIEPVDPATIGTATPSEIPGTPDFYRASQAIVAQLGPGWGYAVFGNPQCAERSPAAIAVVSPDGKAFRTDNLPDGVCGAIPLGATGRLLFLWTGSDMTDGPVYVANLATGRMTLVDPGVTPSMPEGLATSGGTAIVAMRGGDDVSVAISVDAEGRQTKVDLGIDPHNLTWGEVDGHLMFSPLGGDSVALADVKWYSIAPRDRSARDVTVLGAPDSATNCTIQDASGPEGVTFACDDGTYAMGVDGTVKKIPGLNDDHLHLTASYNELQEGDVGDLDAHVGFPLASGTVMALDPIALNPGSTGPWTRASEVTAYGTAISAGIGGVEADYVQPIGDDYYGMVVALTSKEGTMVVLPSLFDGVPTSADEWLWWSGD